MGQGRASGGAELRRLPILILVDQVAHAFARASVASTGDLVVDIGKQVFRQGDMVRAKAKIGMRNLAYNMRRLGQLRRLNPFPA